VKRATVVIAGGGAAGFFAACVLAESGVLRDILILEKDREVLQKVRISGGGRCNVTHACFDPFALVGNYPRGQKEMLAPFHQFQPNDMMNWLANHGISLKTEKDGRVFPVTDSSQTIIGCFLEICKKNHVKVHTREKVEAIRQQESGWELHTNAGIYFARYAILAGGSSQSLWNTLQQLGYSLIDPVPSLFTFKIPDKALQELAGTSIPHVKVGIPKLKYRTEGPLLITHWGLSGPAVLKLSAIACRAIHHGTLPFELQVNWVNQDRETTSMILRQTREKQPKKLAGNENPFGLPQRLWQYLCKKSKVDPSIQWAHINSTSQSLLTDNCCMFSLQVTGKSTNKEEFVTAGGISLKEIHFKSFESKRFPGLYLAGEILDIDGLTGGYNFQAAWTGAFLSAQDIIHKIKSES